MKLFDRRVLVKPSPILCSGRWWWPFHSWRCKESESWLFFYCEHCKCLRATPLPEEPEG